MVDILKRSLAPVTNAAWQEIDFQAKRSLKGNLSARGIVDFSGPHGWEYAAVNTGQLDYRTKKPVGGVAWGLREVLPLVEIRVPFKLDIMDLDSVARGSKVPELTPILEAARRVAIFEEQAIYYGFKDGAIQGIAQATPLKPLTLSKTTNTYQETIEAGIIALQKEGIEGPYELVLGDVPYKALMSGDERGYPLVRRIKDITAGDIRWSPVVKGGMMISKRGGDFEITVGQDLAVGYHSHTATEVELYITESFTFQVLEPLAAIEFKLKL